MGKAKSHEVHRTVQYGTVQSGYIIITLLYTAA